MNTKIAIPMLETHIQAGFPSPAENYIERALDLNELCISHPAATYFLRVSGDSMIGCGIYHDSILIVDRQLTACSGNIIIAEIEREFTVKRYIVNNKQVILKTENTDYANIKMTTQQEWSIWGVVTFVINAL